MKLIEVTNQYKKMAQGKTGGLSLGFPPGPCQGPSSIEKL